MSYHIKDLIADLTTVEKAELMIEAIDLLEAVNYSNHVEKLEDILMTSDMYPLDETVSIIESTLIASLIDCCKQYGFYIYDANYDLLKLNNVFQLSRAFFILMGDEPKPPSDSTLVPDNIKRMIGFLEPLVELDEFELLELINEVDDELIDAIETDEVLLEPEEVSNLSSLIRLRKTNILEQAPQAKGLIMSIGCGYDFYEMLSSFKKEISKIEKLDLKAIEFVALLLGSDLHNNDLHKYSDETIDYIAANDEEATGLRTKVNRLLREYDV